MKSSRISYWKTHGLIQKKYNLAIEIYQLSERVKRGTYEGSSWNTHSILQRHFVISEIAPCEGSSHFPLPKELRNSKKELINIQNGEKDWLICKTTWS